MSFDLGARADGTHDHTRRVHPARRRHGFGSLTDMTITYLVDGYYNAADELGVAWDDPEIGADWGLTEPVLSDRDQRQPGPGEDRASPASRRGRCAPEVRP